jgi:hypothetical protein
MAQLADRIAQHYERHAIAWDADRRKSGWNDEIWYARFIEALPEHDIGDDPILLGKASSTKRDQRRRGINPGDAQSACYQIHCNRRPSAASQIEDARVLGRVTRDIERRIVGDEDLREAFIRPLYLARRVLEQERHQRGRNVYSLHASEVECIGKGSEHCADESFEAAPEHALGIERHGLRVYAGHARVGHGLGVDLVAVRVRAVGDERERTNSSSLRSMLCGNEVHFPAFTSSASTSA